MERVNFLFKKIPTTHWYERTIKDFEDYYGQIFSFSMVTWELTSFILSTHEKEYRTFVTLT
jgi:hypothetical protein